MIKLVLENKTILLPSQWNELGLTQLLYYLRYFYTQTHNLISNDEDGQAFIKDDNEWRKMQLGLLRGLVQMGNKEFYKYINDRVAFELIDDHKVIDFMIKELKPLRLPIRSIKSFYGPVEFGFLCTSEFALADIQYVLAKKALANEDDDKLLKHLQLFTAIIYRQKSFTKFGDKRILFNKHSVDVRAKALNKIRKWELLAIMLWYESHRQTLPTKFPDAFDSTGQENTSALPDWQSAMLTVAESGTFGDFNNLERTPALYFIKEIDRKKRNNREQIENLKNKNHAV
jgi:hypothetical protein